MKKNSKLQILLEIIVILGNLIIGVTVLSYQFLSYEINKELIGLVTLAIGVIGVTEFASLKYLAKIKNIQSALISVLGAVLGIVFIFTNLELGLMAMILAIAGIAFLLVSIVTTILNILRQPLLNGIRAIISIVGIVLSIILLISGVPYLPTYFTFIGIALLVQFAVLLIEFIIHRYQN